MLPPRVAGIALALVVAGAPLGSRAQVRPPAAIEDPDTTAAKRRFEKGIVHYNRGEFAAALVEFQAARRLKPAPAFDYNIARCADRLERYGEAIEGYESWLAAMPAAPDAPQVRERLRVLRARVASPPTPTTATPTPTPTPTPTSTTSSTAPDPQRSSRVAGAILLATGGVALVTGAALLGVGASHAGSVNDAATLDERDARIASARTETIAGAVIASASALAILPGALLLARARKGPERTGVYVLPTLGGLVAGGRF